MRGSQADMPFRLATGRKMRGAAAVGAVVQFRIEPDMEERAIQIPTELMRVLDEDRRLRRWYEGLSYSIRKYFAYMITEAKSGEARERRAEQIAECLLSAMEAERELPPALKSVFAENPRAMKGWKMMTPVQRRGHLMGIFYYRNPVSRAKRIGKAMGEAAAIAERRGAGRSERPQT